jgi:hypothetical protein
VADRIATLAGEVARRIAAQLPDLTPAMTAMFIDIIPGFRHDQAVQRLMVASTSSNLSAVVDMLMLGISLEDISVPPAAAEYARPFAQHDLSLAVATPCASGSNEPSASWHETISRSPGSGDSAGVVGGERELPRCSPATNSRQRPRLRYLGPLDQRVEQQASASVCGPGVGYLPSKHAGRSKARYSLAVTTASAGRVRISAGSGTTWRETMIDLPARPHRHRGQARNRVGGA